MYIQSSSAADAVRGREKSPGGRTERSETKRTQHLAPLHEKDNAAVTETARRIGMEAVASLWEETWPLSGPLYSSLSDGQAAIMISKHCPRGTDLFHAD